MYRKDLQNLLTKTNFPNFFLLYGACNFQNELYANFIKKKWLVDENLKLFFEEYNFSQASDFLSGGSLFSEKKLLEIKTSKKISNKDLKHLIELCKQNTDNFLLLSLYDENSKQSEMEKIFENNFTRFFPPNNAKEGIELLMMKAKELEINITQNALFLLFSNFDENLYLAASELNKFQGLSIDEKVIEKYCFSLSIVNFDTFFEKILQGKNFSTDLEKILDNFNEIALINSLNSNFYRLFKIALYAKIYGKMDFKELFGFTPPPQIAKKLEMQAFEIKISQYRQIFTLLLESEYEIKTNSKLTKKEFLIATLLKLSQILKNK